MSSPLSDALGIERGIVTVVGAGGKTTIVYRLAAEAAAAGRRVLVTTTTHMGIPRDAEVGPVFHDVGTDTNADVRRALETKGRAVLLGPRVREDKVQGLTPERVDALLDLAELVLVEGDGARQRSFKTPAAHEPVIPGRTTLVVVVVGLDVLGRPLDTESVHRLELVLAASGQAAGSLITEETIARTLGHPEGYLARVPAAARSAIFINKVESAVSLEAAHTIAARLCPPYERVVAGSARDGQAQTLRAVT